FNKIYFQGKAALADTFSAPVHEPSHRDGDPATLFPGESETMARLRREARLETVTLGVDMPCASRTIRELALRTQTGAVIVAIQREGREPIVNPSVDET